VTEADHELGGVKTGEVEASPNVDSAPVARSFTSIKRVGLIAGVLLGALLLVAMMRGSVPVQPLASNTQDAVGLAAPGEGPKLAETQFVEEDDDDDEDEDEEESNDRLLSRRRRRKVRKYYCGSTFVDANDDDAGPHCCFDEERSSDLDEACEIAGNPSTVKKIHNNCGTYENCASYDGTPGGPGDCACCREQSTETC